MITNKAREQTFKKSVTTQLSKEIKKAGKQMIIIHGAGSFGHILAKKYRLDKGFQKDEQIQGFSLTHAMVQKLNTLVLDILLKNGIPAISLPPHSILRLNKHILHAFNGKIFEKYLEMGFTPVTFGDVVLDDSFGFSICSGDLLVLVLARHFRPEKVIFVIDEDGLYSKNPKIHSDAELIKSGTLKDLEKLTTTTDPHADVTKGMKGKIDTIKNISQHGIDTILLNGNKQDRLFNVLVGRTDTYTIVHGEKL